MAEIKEPKIPCCELVPKASLQEIVRTKAVQMYRAEYVKMAKEILALREEPPEFAEVTDDAGFIAVASAPAAPCPGCKNSVGMRDASQLRAAITGMDIGLHWAHTQEGASYWADVVSKLGKILRTP